MNAFVALLALVIDRAFPQLDALRERRWFPWYSDAMREQFGDMRAWGAVLPVLLLVGVPAALVHVASELLAAAHPILGAVFGTLVVVALLGPANAVRCGTAYADALDGDAEPEAAARAAALLGGDAPDARRARSEAVVDALATASVVGTYAGAFWTLVAGPAGCVLWRLATELARNFRDRPDDDAGRRVAEELVALLGWLPVRAFALSCAVVGRFEEALAAWRAAGPRALEVRVLRGALRLEADEEDGGSHLVWSALALLDRALVGWCAIAVLVWLVGLGG